MCNTGLAKGTIQLLEGASDRELKDTTSRRGRNMDLSDLGPGIYIVRLLSDDGQSPTKRLLITRDE